MTHDERGCCMEIGAVVSLIIFVLIQIFKE